MTEVVRTWQNAVVVDTGAWKMDPFVMIYRWILREHMYTMHMIYAVYIIYYILYIYTVHTDFEEKNSKANKNDTSR